MREPNLRKSPVQRFGSDQARSAAPDEKIQIHILRSTALFLLGSCRCAGLLIRGPIAAAFGLTALSLARCLRLGRSVSAWVRSSLSRAAVGRLFGRLLALFLAVGNVPATALEMNGWPGDLPVHLYGRTVRTLGRTRIGEGLDSFEFMATLLADKFVDRHSNDS